MQYNAIRKAIIEKVFGDECFGFFLKSAYLCSVATLACESEIRLFDIGKGIPANVQVIAPLVQRMRIMPEGEYN